MKKSFLIFALIFLAFQITQARVRYVDKKGGAGRYTTIQAAIDAAIEGDTVRILPGIYNESITIGKNIVVQGGGILNTHIVASNGPAVSQSSGKLMWVSIRSDYGDGIQLTNGIITNCYIHDCLLSGVYLGGTGLKVYNCISINNQNGYLQGNSVSYSSTIYNSIAVWNKNYGFYNSNDQNYNVKNMILRYCNAFGNSIFDYSDYFAGGIFTIDLIGTIINDPSFAPDGSYRISGNSPCKNTGDPLVYNLDGTRSDMGYYGGPDAPLLPYITMPINYKLNPDGTIQFDMQGKVGY